MIIKQLNLDHFGKFHDREIHLEKGINIVYGANESGKSTVHSFIQCMLFGTERLRGRGAGKDIYTKYQPWDGGGSYEGRMRLTCQDQNWRLMRNFHKDDSHLTVIDETGGREIPCREDDISSLIDGMTLSNYRNSISSGQLSLQPDGQFTTGMQSYMANMAMGATDNVDVGKALNYLKEERKKAASKFSHQEYEDCVKEAENLRRELEGRMALMSQQKALERERENILERIRQLECDVDDAMKQDRQERMKAIRLIQENNDVAAMYKAKKAELREMENQTGSQKYQQHLNDVMEEYEVRQNKLEDFMHAMNEIGVTGITITNVMGCGVQKGARTYYRGIEMDMNLLPKIKIEIVVSLVPVQTVLKAAKEVLHTGQYGDGKVFIYDIENVVKIRTGEEGYLALQDTQPIE